MDTYKETYEFDNENYFDIRNSLATHLKEKIDTLMLLNQYKKIIILCIGTDKINEDSYGPILGSALLQSELYTNISIFGTMGKNLKATNIESFISEKASIMDESLVIAIDSAVSEDDSIGTIIVSDNGMYPGSACGKSLSNVGDFSIYGVTTNDSSIFDTSNTDIKRFIEGDISTKKLKQMCNITADALFMALGLEMNSEKIISKYIKQLENKKMELEKILMMCNYTNLNKPLKLNYK